MREEHGRFRKFADVKTHFKVITGWVQPWHFNQSGMRVCKIEGGKVVYKDGDEYVVTDMW
jgi:hypothetical protein